MFFLTLQRKKQIFKESEIRIFYGKTPYKRFQGQNFKFGG